MRVKLFVEVEVNEQKVIAGAAGAAPDDQLLAAIPESFRKATAQLLEKVIPGVDAINVTAIPELTVTRVQPVRLI